MNPKILIGGIVVVVVLLVLVPFVSGGGGGTPASAPAQQGGNATQAPAGERSAPAAQAPAQSAPAAQPGVPNMTANDLQNTTWQIQGINVSLLPNGVAQATVPGLGQVQGTWNVSGSQLNVSAMGQSITAEIRGQQLIARGQPVQRVR